jgi:hypothetical protein
MKGRPKEKGFSLACWKSYNGLIMIRYKYKPTENNISRKEGIV